MNRHIVFAWCCALLAAGCSLGRAVVDHHEPEAGVKFPWPVCRHVPACEPPASTFRPPQRRLETDGLPACSIELPLDGELDARGGEMELRDCRLELVVSGPARVRVLGARMSNVLIDLHGPIRLELSEGSSLALSQIRAEPEQGSSSLLLEDATATDLIVTGGRGWTLDITRTALTGALLTADRAEVETSTLQHVGLQTKELRMVASLLEHSQLTVERGTLSASEFFNNSVTSGCDTLLLAGTEIADSRFGACRGALRLHNDIVRRSALDGPLEGDMITLEESVLGLAAPTRLWAWESYVYDSRFCAFSEQARFADVSLHCARCEEGPFAKTRADVCYDPATKIDTVPNKCPAFDEPVPCEGEFPDRGWPEDRLPQPGLPGFPLDGGPPQP